MRLAHKKEGKNKVRTLRVERGKSFWPASSVGGSISKTMRSGQRESTGIKSDNHSQGGGPVLESDQNFLQENILARSYAVRATASSAA